MGGLGWPSRTTGQDFKFHVHRTGNNAGVHEDVQKRDVFAVVTSASKAAVERPGNEKTSGGGRAMKRLLEYAEEGVIVLVAGRSDGPPLIDVLNTPWPYCAAGVSMSGPSVVSGYRFGTMKAWL